MKQMLDILKVAYPSMGETILVADDNIELVHHFSEQILPAIGYHVMWATDGTMTLSKIRDERPDLVLLDLDMPEKTGLDVLRAIKDDTYHPLIILMTGTGSEQAAVEAFRLGANEYLQKPFTTEQLVKTIRQTLDIEIEAQECASRQLHEMRHQQDNFDQLLLHSKAIVSASAIEDVINRTLNAMMNDYAADYSFIHLNDHHATWEQHAVEQYPSQSYITNPILSCVLENGKSIQQCDDLMGIDIGANQPIRTLLIIPILTMNKETIGALGIGQFSADRVFSSSDEQLLQTLGEYAAIALSNIKLIKEAEKRSSLFHM